MEWSSADILTALLPLIVISCIFVPLLIAIILFCGALKQDLLQESKVQDEGHVDMIDGVRTAWCEHSMVNETRREEDQEMANFLEDLYL
ncbi:unnamed protein product [Caenorhabditis brenneri]